MRYGSIVINPRIIKQSKQWTEAGASAPKKAKVKSADKVLASVF